MAETKVRVRVNAEGSEKKTRKVVDAVVLERRETTILVKFADGGVATRKIARDVVTD